MRLTKGKMHGSKNAADEIRAFFDLETFVTKHSHLEAPLVVALGRDYNLENLTKRRHLNDIPPQNKY